ncbi:MAG: hypothetical protein WDM96_19975 [Lacunisphaera sp.]
MANKKIEKALYGPSTTEVALGAILGLVAGLLVACVYLVFKPVQLVKEMPKEPVRGAVYFIPGSDNPTKGKSFAAKQKALAGGSSVELNEDELNAWASATFRRGSGRGHAGPGARQAAGAQAGGKTQRTGEARRGGEGSQGSNQPAYDGIFNPGTPNFKIKDGTLQIGFKCVLNWYGLLQEVTVLTTGTLSRSGDDVVYSPRTIFLGSCPVHLIPGAAGPLMSHLIGKKKAPDEINSAWAKVKSATIEGSTLKLSIE